MNFATAASRSVTAVLSDYPKCPGSLERGLDGFRRSWGLFNFFLDILVVVFCTDWGKGGIHM